MVEVKKYDVVLDTFRTTKDVDIFNILSRTPLIVIYKNTAEYGDKYVARLWEYRKLNKNSPFTQLPQSRYIPTIYIVLADSMAEISKKIPWFLNFLPRYMDDDPCIVGVYI